MAASVAFPLVPRENAAPGAIADESIREAASPAATAPRANGVAPVDSFSAALGSVAARPTPLSADEAGAALGAAWQAAFGEPATSQTLSVLVGHWAHETGGGRAMMNYNFGGLKGRSAAGGSASYRTTEGSGASASHVVAAFRAYDGAAAGAADYLKLLRARYPAALDAARAGDPTGFVHALKQGGYFTDNEASYARSVTRLAGQLGSQGIDVHRGAEGLRHDGALSAMAPASINRAAPLANRTAALDTKQTAATIRSVDVQSFSDAIMQAALRILSTAPSGQSET